MTLSIHWFRNDLRLSDNPALIEAVDAGEVLGIYILDDASAGSDAMGAASRCWLHHSLSNLDERLKNNLNVYMGDAEAVFTDLLKHHGVTQVTWNRSFEPWRVKQDADIKAMLDDEDIEVVETNGTLLWDPDCVLKDNGDPYRVFTPYYKNGCLPGIPPREPERRVTSVSFVKDKANKTSIQDLDLLPDRDWGDSMMSHWDVGENASHRKLDDFLEDDVDRYAEDRDRPGVMGTSRLSPHLHFGEISPNQIWHRLKASNRSRETFLRELGWREFSYYLLHHFPEIRRKNFQDKFDPFPWRKDKQSLSAWQKGQTGIPIVDAGMRELWETGYVHNRVRMIVGSFLVKNLLIDWREGESWFWDCLVDADMASNAASWQWVAGSGADAAPFFRIFNPVLQGEKFDAAGDYTRHFCPELSKLPEKYLHHPWDAPESVLEEAGIKLGRDYPKPIVDLKETRKRALDAHKQLSH